jgi:hypothetical protein
MTARYAIRGHSSAIAGGFLLAFCWLGWAAVRFGSIFQGMGMEHSLPVANWFAATYGPIAFPLFGILAAAAFVLSDLMFRKRWIEWALIAAFALLLIFALRGFLICGVFMAPNVRFNKRIEPMTRRAVTLTPSAGAINALVMAHPRR